MFVRNFLLQQRVKFKHSCNNNRECGCSKFVPSREYWTILYTTGIKREKIETRYN